MGAISRAVAKTKLRSDATTSHSNAGPNAFENVAPTVCANSVSALTNATSVTRYGADHAAAHNRRGPLCGDVDGGGRDFPAHPKAVMGEAKDGAAVGVERDDGVEDGPKGGEDEEDGGEGEMIGGEVALVEEAQPREADAGDEAGGGGGGLEGGEGDAAEDGGGGF